MKAWLKRQIKRNKSIYRLLRFISDSVGFECRKQYMLLKSRGAMKVLTDRKKIFLLITPTTGNIGDQAIAHYSTVWLKDTFPEYELIEVPEEDMFTMFKSLKRIITGEDMIFLQGGGNLGDWYVTTEKTRHFIIKEFPDNLIVQMPQSIDFSRSYQGKTLLNSAKSIYNNHRRLIIATRDRVSYEYSREYFPRVKTLLVPDIVLSALGGWGGGRHGVLICLRNDHESAIGPRTDEIIEEVKRSFFCSITVQDTWIDQRVTEVDREWRIKEMLNLFGSHEVVLTDRYHGVIFSALTRTPCVTLGINGHKITSGLDWVKPNGGVTPSSGDYVREVREALKQQVDVAPLSYQPLYNKLRDIIREGTSV